MNPNECASGVRNRSDVKRFSPTMSPKLLPSEPPPPTKVWPLEYWLRRAAVVAGLILMDANGVRAVPFLVLLSIVGSGGYKAARWSGDRRRGGMDDPRRRLWYYANWTRGSRLRARWGWRAAWALGFLMLANTVSYHIAFIVVALWSMGWIIGEFVDRRSAAGIEEWQRWRSDLERWEADAPLRRLADEWRWAAPFPTYQAYCDARAGRRGSPLTYEDFDKARSGKSPDSD